MRFLVVVMLSAISLAASNEYHTGGYSNPTDAESGALYPSGPTDSEGGAGYPGPTDAPGGAGYPSGPTDSEGGAGYPSPTDSPGGANYPGDSAASQDSPDLAAAQGLACPRPGYMFPDPNNLCFVWFCETASAAPIKRACPKGVRVPSWWDGGELNMCFITNIVKHFGDPICLRCDTHDIPPNSERCASNPCDPECECENTEYTFRCICPETGIFTPVAYVPPPRDHCSPQPCENGASCQNQWDGFFCFCPPGWTGHRCEQSVCDWHPCLNGGTCVIDEIGYHCECTNCWTGSCCNVTVPGCAIDGGGCASCKTGAFCDSFIDTCDCIPPESDPCSAGSECVNTDTGPSCQACDEPECFTLGCKIRKDTCSCMKGQCPPNSRCEDLIDLDSHECVCDECWDGPQCNIRKNTCACNDPCPSTSTCQDTNKGPMCACDTCSKGSYCDEPIISCNCNSPCKAGSACSMTLSGEPQCFCEDSCYFGQGCSQKKNTCECNSPCSAGEECTELNGQLTCGCVDPCRTGPNCANTIQTCACLAPCGSTETCLEGADGAPPVCICTDSCRFGPGCEQTYNTCECKPCTSGEQCTMSNDELLCGCADPCRTGPGCTETVNTCACSNPCNEEQECYLSAGAELSCRCADSCYYGERCDQLVETCECSPCGDGETCVSNDDGSKSHCKCTDACYTGQGCLSKIDTCECNNPCAAGETCSINSNNELTCGCDDSCRTGPGCQDYVNTCRCNNPCNTGQECGLNDSGELYCYCADSCKTGPSCTETIQTCACAQPCQSGELCAEGDDGTAPSCYCSDECQYGPGCSQRYDTCECTTCGAGEVCTLEAGQPTCVCADSCKMGPGCSQTIVSCECTPCASGEACRMEGQATQCYCEDRCQTGPGCADKVNSCECNSPCNADQECYLNSANELSCRCSDSCFEGSNCNTRIESCFCNDPCVGYGTCVESVNGLLCDDCADSCNTGPLCRTRKNICECNNDCASYEECLDSPSGPQCNCPSCYEGETCLDRINSCACNNQCSENGRCHESVDGPVCVCDACWTGERCDVAMNTCECGNTCESFEECTTSGNSHTCACPDCFTGPTCNQKIDSCACNNPCKPADLCKDTSRGVAVCKCNCVGREECVVDTITEREECRCPSCTYNKERERGCPSRITNRCECNTKRCSEDQQVCVDNDDQLGEVSCQIGNPSSGHSFTVAFEENNTEKSFREIPLEVYFSSAVWNDGDRIVRVRTPGLPENHFCHVDETVTVAATTVHRFPLERCLMQNGTGLEQLAIRITEINNRSISVYGINKDRWTADGFLALPDEKAGTEFQTSSYAPAHIATQFCVVVLYDNTEITMKLADDNNLPSPYNKKGSMFRQTLNAFDTYQVQARCDGGGGGSAFRECPLDLSGTEIIASKPIHLFSGNVRAWVPDIYGKSRDHLIEEILPRDRWGVDFAIVAVPHRVVGDLLQIMAVNGQSTKCHIYHRFGEQQTEPEVPTEIDLPYKGRYHRIIDIPSNGMYRLKCEKPVFVTQLTKSQDQAYLYNNETFHDPVTMTIPPITQFTNNFFLNTPQYTGGLNFEPQPYETTYALLVAKAGEQNTIMLNQEPITEYVTSWTRLPRSRDTADPDLVGAVIIIPHGTNIIRNNQGTNFQCLVYGYDDRESYGFPAAMALGKFRS